MVLRLALASASAAALAAPGGSHPRPAQLQRSFTDSATGLSVRYPMGWSLTRWNRTAVTNPVLRFALSAPSGASIELQELVPPLLTGRTLAGFPMRPARFRFAGFVHADQSVGGWATRFQEQQRAFYVFTNRTARGTAAMRATVEAILDGLRVRAVHVVAERRIVLLGRSARGRPIRALELGNPDGARRVLAVGCIHGDECAGSSVVWLLARRAPPRDLDLWLLPNLDPDGTALDRRQNGRGVDLNRNFPSEWRPEGGPWDPQYPGPRPASEPETRIAMRLIGGIRPDVTIWFHQPLALVRAWGGSVRAARRYARLVGLPFRRLLWPAGAATNWQNRVFRGSAAFVVELPPGRLAPGTVRRHAEAILRLAQ